MTDKEELIKACDTLTRYCNRGTNCVNCLFESTCDKWNEGLLDNLSQVVEGFKANLIFDRYGKELDSIRINLITLCQNFNGCHECPFDACEPCPKVAIERVLKDD